MTGRGAHVNKQLFFAAADLQRLLNVFGTNAMALKALLRCGECHNIEWHGGNSARGSKLRRIDFWNEAPWFADLQRLLNAFGTNAMALKAQQRLYITRRTVRLYTVV